MLSVSCSVGITMRGAGAATADVLREADVAMFRAKAAGGGRWVFFEHDMDTEARDRLDREVEMRTALAEGDFVLYYQPIVALESGKIESVEALLRWNDPVHGIVTPDSFIPLAERTGLILPLGRWAIQEACRQVRRWADVGIDLGVSVNLSVAQFQDKAVVDDIASAIRDAGISATRLTLEVTESVTIDRPDEAIATMRAIEELGVSIALDDFGQGYAFLGHLKRFPTTVVKIDRAFVGGLTTSAEDQAIVRAVVSLAHDLGKRVVAEGVETAEQFHEVRRLGCDRVQGYLVSRPVPAQAITDLLDMPLRLELPPAWTLENLD